MTQPVARHALAHALVRAGLLMLLLVLPADRAHAQGDNTTVSGGYSFLREVGTEVTPATDYPRGWYISVSRRLGATRLAIVGDVGVNSRTSFDVEVQRLQAFLGGVRFDLAGLSRTNIYAVALAGLERFSEPGFGENGFAFQAGSGADVHLGGRLGARVEAGYRVTRVESATFKGLRLITGVVIRLGS